MKQVNADYCSLSMFAVKDLCLGYGLLLSIIYFHRYSDPQTNWCNILPEYRKNAKMKDNHN